MTPASDDGPLWRRGANWTDPGTGEVCFIAPVDSETCSGCGKHISRHYGGTEYRCEARPEPARAPQPGAPAEPSDADVERVEKFLRAAWRREPTPRERAKFRKACRDLQKLVEEGWFLYLDASGSMNLMSGPSHDDPGTAHRERIVDSEPCGAQGGDW